MFRLVASLIFAVAVVAAFFFLNSAKDQPDQQQVQQIQQQQQQQPNQNDKFNL